MDLMLSTNQQDRSQSPELNRNTSFRLDALSVMIKGTEGDDVLSAAGKTANVLLDGGVGNDRIEGGRGNDALLGGDGNDRLLAGNGDDMVFGGDGDDDIDLGPGDDNAQGGDGNDVIFGREGDDVIDGGRGDDRLMGNEGDDVFVFRRGDGNDTLALLLGRAARLQDGRDTVFFADTDPHDLRSVIFRPTLSGFGDLIVNYGNDDRLTIPRHKAWGEFAAITFRFANGDILSTEALLAMYGGPGGALADTETTQQDVRTALTAFQLQSDAVVEALPLPGAGTRAMSGIGSGQPEDLPALTPGNESGAPPT